MAPLTRIIKWYIINKLVNEQKHIDLSKFFGYLAKLYLCIKQNSKWVILIKKYTRKQI